MEGEVPEGWSVERLDALGSLEKGRGGPKRDSVPTGVPVVRYGELYTHHHDVIREFQSFIPPDRTDDYTPLNEGDVLFAGAGETADEIGKSAVFLGPEPAYGSGDMIIFRADGPVDPLFLGYASNGRVAHRHKVSVGQGSSIMHIYADDLESLELPIPPLPEQKKIAAVLSSVDDAIAATREVIKQTKRVKKGLLQELMTHGIGHTRFKQTKIGEIPEEWEVVRLPQLGGADRPMVKAGPFGSALKKEYYTDSGYKVYGQEQVLEGDPSFGDYYIDEERYSDLETCAVQPGDVLVSLVGTPGKTLVLDEEIQDGVINPRLVRLSPDVDLVRPRYLSYWLESPEARHKLARLSQGGTMDILNSKMLSSLDVPCPPVAEQDAIVERLDSVDDVVANCDEEVGSLEELKRGLMQDLLTGRVRVPVD